MPKKNEPQLICMSAEVAIKAAEGEGSENKPPRFEVEAYTGGAMVLAGFDRPVAVDLEGMRFGNSLVANLDHDSSKRVGNITSKVIDGGKLILGGIASAATDARREVVESSANGFVWQASIEAIPLRIESVDEGGTASVNGQTFDGPLYVARQSTLKGFAFVSHGADDNTTVSIAANADTGSKKGNDMDPELKKWIEAMGFDVDSLSDQQIEGLKANYAGDSPAPKPKTKPSGVNGFEAIRAENDRKSAINSYALQACERDPHNLDAIKMLAEQAIEEKWEYDKFRLNLLEAQAPSGHTPIHCSKPDKIDERTLEAAVCMAGGLPDIEKHFPEQTLEAADRRFKGGIGLNQLFNICAETNGHKPDYASKVSIEAHNAAFGMAQAPHMRAAGFSTVSLTNILSNTANKFLHRGFNAVDQTPQRIAAIRSVRDFKQVTTVTLVGDHTFEKVGPTGEIKHGVPGERSYTNQADTYARMLAITRTDLINDDLGALTDVPMKLGRGAGISLNEIFWTEFLDNSAFFKSANSNVSTDTGLLGTTGLEEAETIFMDQTDPDGDPLLIEPAILLVPTALKSTAMQLMRSEKLKGDTNEPDANIFRGRFRVESSPYMSNSSYTGYSAVAWYLLADPSVMPVIEIAALNGRIEPTVETTDAAFNVLGVQMRGYSDVGVSKQEYRGGVRADGSAAG